MADNRNAGKNDCLIECDRFFVNEALSKWGLHKIFYLESHRKYQKAQKSSVFGREHNTNNL